MIKVLAYIFIWGGVGFDLFGALGLIRFPDLYNRLQAATKCVTLGTSGILFGLFMLNGFTAMGIKCLICAAFILLTSPTASHAIARGAYTSGLKLWKGSVTDKLGEDKKGGPQIDGK
jgi:multicomponent Na+:H+ antiporter subunit G